MVYFIERYKKNKTKLISDTIDNFISSITKKIEKNIEDLIVTESTFYKEKVIYFGLAHGISGYINFLLYIEKNYLSLTKDLKTSLEKCVNYLISFKRYDDVSKLYFPGMYKLDSNSTKSSRLAWCQGDMGISNSLFNYGSYSKNTNILNESRKLILNTKKIQLKDSIVRDFGICHGSAGIILQYHLASLKYKINFNFEIQYWIEIINKQTCKFTKFDQANNNNKTNEISILEGSSGLGLSLLSIENKIDLKWLSILNLH